MQEFWGNKTRSFIATGLFVALFVSLISAFISSPDVSAYTASISTSGTVTTNVKPKGDGTTGTSISTDSVNVVTNCRAGYNLTISGPSDRNLYLNGNSSNNTSGQYFTPVDGTSQLSSTTNAWGYSLTANTESGVFTPLPSTPTLIKTATQTASQTDINDNIPVYYGVSVSNTLAPGLYKMANSGTILYQLTLDDSCMTYTVAFNANGGTGSMTSQEITVDTATKLTANSFTAPALGQSYQNAAGTTISATAGKLWTFWGWNTAIDGTGDWYKDRESVTNLTTNGNTITLYAQWKQAVLGDMTIPTTGTKTITNNTMQDMNGAICWNSDITTKAELEAASKTGAVTLTDNRDGTSRSYDVSKLADGNCWMTTNLALGTTSPVTLTSDDTDLAEGTTFTLPAGDTTTSSTNTQAKIRLTNESDGTTNGVYYSWAAAVADITSRSDIPTTSICPKNWDLPTDDQFGTLSTASAYSSTNPTTDLPSQFLVTGKFTNGTTFYPTSTEYGFYWTSTSDSTTVAYGRRASTTTLYSNSSSGTTYGGNKYYRKNIRCIANTDEARYRITYVNTTTGETQTQLAGIVGQNESVQLEFALNWATAGYGISGWDTNSSGTDVVYTKGQTIVSSSNLTLYTVWKPTYTIQYDGNSADAGVMTDVKHINVFEGDIFDLYASNFSKTNYGFAGWSFNSSAQPGGSSRIYGPNEAITAPAPSTPGETKTLYAVWVASAGNIQDWRGCSAMNIGDVTALKDTRDNNVYTVGKLADENCWMMENLRLDTANSNDSTKAQGFNGAFNGLASSESRNFNNTANANSLYYSGTQSGTATIDIGAGYYPGYRMPRHNAINSNSRSANPSATDDRSIATSTHGTSLNTDIYSYGNYYTWAAAKASTIYYQNSTTSNNAGTSICPSGWELPYGKDGDRGANSGGFYYLGTRLGATASGEISSRIWRSYPNNFIYSGNYLGSARQNRGSGGFCWTSTTQDQSGDPPYSNMQLAGFFRLYNKDLQMTFYTSKYDGLPVRCLVAKGLEIKLISNDGTNRVNGRIYGEAGSTVTLPGASREGGYRFTGWNTNADGSGINYSSSYTFDSLATTGITLYAQWVQTDCPSFSVCYEANGGNIEGTMGQQAITISENTTVTAMASNYSRSGYGFAGWNTKADGTGISYGPNETIQFLHGTLQSGGLTLYAMWVQSAGDLQDWSGCSNLVIGGVTALKDTRDNQVYAVARLADGNCWMIENLRLESTNSDNSAGTYAQGYGTGFVGLADAESANFSNSTTANTLYSTTNITGSYQGYRFPRYNNNNTQSRADSPTSGNGTNIYGYGNYYTWAAAKANIENLTTAADSNAQPTSICPAGWRLPTGTGSGDFGMLSNSLGGYKDVGGVAQQMNSYTAPTGSEMSKIFRTFPNNFIYSGYFNGSTASSRSDSSYYWSSTVNSSDKSYAFYLGSAQAQPGTNNSQYKYYGDSVRCVLNQSNTGSTRITFNKNNSSATGSMSVQTINAGASVALTANGFSRSGYQFNSWNTEADGSGTSYANEESYYAVAGNETTNVTLYAQWDQVATITFSLGSNVTGVYLDGTTYTNGQTVQAIVGKEYIITGLFNTKYGINSWSATAGTIANNSVATTTYIAPSSNATISITAKEATVDITTLTNPSTPVSSNCKNEAVVPELVYDPRDNEAYYVARLCDGKYWMLDNLRLDLTNSTVINNLSSSNTNATTTQLNYLKNGGGTTTDQYPTAGLTGSNWTSGYSYSAPRVKISGSVTTGVNENTWTGSYTKNTIAPVVYGVGSGKVGIYYNYCAASAGSYCWGNGNSSTGSPSTDPNSNSYRDIEGDICPAGWHLPSGNTNSGTTRITDYGTLYVAYSGASLGQSVAFRDALSLSLSGYINSGTTNNQGTLGHYWSATWKETYADSMYYTNSNSSGASPSYSAGRTIGKSIRCVLGD